MISHDTVIADTQHWLEQAVIGLNLCPFAKAVHVKQQIRYVVSSAKTEAALLDDLLQEMDFLMAANPTEVDTILLIHPLVLTDFLDYNDFLDVADGATAEPEFDNALQVASFHPQYQFADTDVDDIENYTNRSPYPMLHILREDSIARAVAAFPEASDIYENNMATLRKLGLAGWKSLLGKS
jgi:hypothetical protein